MRALPILLAALVCSAPIIAAAMPVLPVVTRASVLVERDEILLGDLFRGAGERGGTVVGQAPAAGQTVVFGQRELTELAQEHALAWSPGGRQPTRVSVERQGQRIDPSRIAALVVEHVRAEAPDRDVRISLDDSAAIILSPGSGSNIRIDSLREDQRRHRVEAVIVVDDGSGRLERHVVTGRIDTMTMVPTLREPVAPGTPIRADQVEWVRLPANQLGNGVVSDVGELAGAALRRPVAPGAPIRGRDLQTVNAVNRGAMVTLIYRTPTMTLSARGRSLDDGALGQTVRIVNQHSDRTIEAVVTGTNEVDTSPAHTLMGSLR